MAAKPLPGYVNWKDPSAMIVQSANTIETKRGALGASVITPSDRLYVHNNLPPPSPDIVKDRNAWEISVDGATNPRKLSVGQLKSTSLQTTAVVLQCSGNGPGFFPSKPIGTQ